MTSRDLLKVVERSQKSRAESRNAKIREYFYGLHNNLYPHTFEVKFTEVEIYKIGGTKTGLLSSSPIITVLVNRCRGRKFSTTKKDKKKRGKKGKKSSLHNKPSRSMCCRLAIGAGTKILPIQ